MANKSTKFPQTNVGASTPRPMSSEQHDHLKSLVDHTITSAKYNAHGHAVGKGATGKMVPSHSHLQVGSYLPQGALQNRQNTSSDGAGSAEANDPATRRRSRVNKG